MARVARGVRWVASALGFGCFVLSLGGCGSPGGGAEVTVVYPKASGLEVGDEVRMSDFTIGRVEELELEPDGRVAVRIDLEGKYASYVTEGSTFRVKRESVTAPGRYIEMKPGQGEPVPEGTRFEGDLPWEERLRSLGQELIDSVGEVDFQKQLEELAAAAERAAEAGREEWEARRPELEAEAKALLEKLEEDGSAAADRLREKLDEYLDELEEPAEPDTPNSHTI